MITRTARCIALPLVLASLLAPSSAMAANPGDFDTAFGTGGLVTLDTNPADLDDPVGIAVQTDGKVLIGHVSNTAPYARVVRYTAAGVLDTTWAGDGIAEVSGTGISGGVEGLALGPDGGVYIGGTAALDGGSIVVAKLNSTGVLDTTWGGGDGFVFESAGGAEDMVRALQVDAAGRLVVGGGYGTSGPADYEPMVMRFTTAGALDPGFNGAGRFIQGLLTNSDARIRDIATDSQNRVLFTFAQDGGVDYDTALNRVDANGVQDSGFNSSNIQYRVLAGDQDAGVVAVDSSDRPIVAYSPGTNIIDVVRYTTSGLVDTSFATAGVRSVTLPGTYASPRDISVNADGSILIAFASEVGAARQTGVLKLTATSAVDTSFGGGDGYILFGADSGFNTSSDKLALGPDGSAFVASDSGVFPDSDLDVRKVLDRFADLSVTINRAAIAVDDLGTYNFVVTNNGPTSIPLTLTVTLPATSLTLFSSATSPEGTCSRIGQVVTCTYGSVTGNGSSVSANIRMQARSIGTPTLTAVASSTLIDPTGATATDTMELFRRAETSASIRSVTARGKTRKCGTRTSKACVLTRTKKSFHYVAGNVLPLRTAAAERKLTVRMQINIGGNRWKTVREVAGSTNSSGKYTVRLKGKGLKKGLYRVQTRVPQSSRNAAGVSRLVYLKVR